MPTTSGTLFVLLEPILHVLEVPTMATDLAPYKQPLHQAVAERIQNLIMIICGVKAKPIAY